MIELIALGMVVSFQLAIVETGFQRGLYAKKTCAQLSKSIERPINLDKYRWNEGNTQNSWCHAPVMSYNSFFLIGAPPPKLAQKSLAVRLGSTGRPWIKLTPQKSGNLWGFQEDQQRLGLNIFWGKTRKSSSSSSFSQQFSTIFGGVCHGIPHFQTNPNNMGLCKKWDGIRQCSVFAAGSMMRLLQR